MAGTPRASCGAASNTCVCACVRCGACACVCHVRACGPPQGTAPLMAPRAARHHMEPNTHHPAPLPHTHTPHAQHIQAHARCGTRDARARLEPRVERFVQLENRGDVAAAVAVVGRGPDRDDPLVKHPPGLFVGGGRGRSSVRGVCGCRCGCGRRGLAVHAPARSRTHIAHSTQRTAHAHGIHTHTCARSTGSTRSTRSTHARA